MIFSKSFSSQLDFHIQRKKFLGLLDSRNQQSRFSFLPDWRIE
jgi:hypothetical protein